MPTPSNTVWDCGISGRISPPSTAALDRKSTRLNSSHTVIYTLSLHDALPIYSLVVDEEFIDDAHPVEHRLGLRDQRSHLAAVDGRVRSEEHTSELQSHSDLHSFPTRRSSDLLPCRRRGIHRRCPPRRTPSGIAGSAVASRRRRRPR